MTQVSQQSESKSTNLMELLITQHNQLMQQNSQIMQQNSQLIEQITLMTALISDQNDQILSLIEGQDTDLNPHGTLD